MRSEKQIRKDAQKYNSIFYFFSQSKEKYCQNTVDLFQDIARTSGVTFVYHGEAIHFIIPECCQRFNVIIDNELADDQYGAYEFGATPPVVRINSHMLANGGHAHGITAHESNHGLQENIAQSTYIQGNNSIREQFVLMLKSNIDTVKCNSLFGLVIDGRAYINNTAPAVANSLTDLGDAFYRLAITERYAYAAEKAYSMPSENDRLEAKNRWLQQALQTIRDRYECDNFTDQEICDLVDSVGLKVYLGLKPETAIETLVMYDFVAALSHQCGHMTDNEYKKTADINFVTQEIIKWNVNHPEWVVPFIAKTTPSSLKSISEYYFPNDIASLTHEVQLNNPKLWAYAIANHGQQGAELVFNKSAFLDWCMSPDNDLSDAHMDIIAEYMGKEFSAKSRQESMQKLQMAKETRELRERVKLAEQFRFGIKQTATAQKENRNHDNEVERK